MSAQVEDRHRKAAAAALYSATRERHGEWHPEVAAVAQLLADTEAAAREQGADVYSDSMDAERAGRVARVAELERERDALRSEVERLRPWARFGARAFEDFWQDGYPGDLEGGDLQETARECGLLGRTAEVDAGATHADGCDWQPGMRVDDCDCWAPLLAPYTQEAADATD